MKVLITGTEGQLGRTLFKCAPKSINGSKVEILLCNRKMLDMQNSTECRLIIEDCKPDWLINCAAYTNVEKAEIEKEMALKVNTIAPRIFAENLETYGGKMIQISTDYVFDGFSEKPYKIDDFKNPLNFYGKTKSLAEDNLNDIFKGNDLGHTIRTSWLISSFGENFVVKILALHSKMSEIKIVNDQIGCPTSTKTVAKSCWKLIEQRINKIPNIPQTLHCTDLGEGTWYELARSIGEIGAYYDLIKKPAITIPIKTKEYKTLAKRPNYSVLDCENTYDLLEIKPSHWKENLVQILEELKNKNS